jgi:hypothetical protein
MTVDPANAHELAEIAGEVGADVLEGALWDASEAGDWHTARCVRVQQHYRHFTSEEP